MAKIGEHINGTSGAKGGSSVPPSLTVLRLKVNPYVPGMGSRIKEKIMRINPMLPLISPMILHPIKIITQVPGPRVDNGAKTAF